MPRCKGNQTMRSGQLIENNMKKIFHEKSHTKCSGEASQRPFFNNSNTSRSTDCNVIKLFFICSS